MIPDFSEKIQQMNAQAEESKRKNQIEAKHDVEHVEVLESFTKVGEQISQAIERKSNVVEVNNFPEEISTPDVFAVAQEIRGLRDDLELKDTEDTKAHELLTRLLEAVEKLPTEHPLPQEFPGEVSIKNQVDNKEAILEVVEAVKAIQMVYEPQITVKPADVKVENDYSELADKLDMLYEAVRAISIVVPEQDDSKVISAVQKVSQAISALRFPVPNYVLPFKKADGSATQATVSDGGNIISSGRLVTEDFDTITADYPSDTVETYTYSLASVEVAMVTVTYTDNTKELIATVTRL